MDAHPDSTSSSSSSQLTFGVDRILSGAFPSARRPPLHHSAFGPCAECVTSLLRCCRLSDAQVQVQVHSPRPLRPYANLLLGADGAVPSPNVATSSPGGGGSGAKRKRSWSRAVFSNLQRKGLEKRFQLQKYITKPDRRQLAATLGLTDAQVKVWFQNRRMKWRHSKEGKQQQQQQPMDGQHSGGGDVADSTQEDPVLDVQALDS